MFGRKQAPRNEASTRIPFWKMKSEDSLIGNAESTNSRYCLAKRGEIYLIYLPSGNTSQLDFTDSKRTFNIRWFDPRKGGELLEGSLKSVTGGQNVSIGTPPKDIDEDWLVIIR